MVYRPWRLEPPEDPSGTGRRSLKGTWPSRPTGCPQMPRSGWPVVDLITPLIEPAGASTAFACTGWPAGAVSRAGPSPGTPARNHLAAYRSPALAQLVNMTPY